MEKKSTPNNFTTPRKEKILIGYLKLNYLFFF
jgi:hypothetical protein